MSVRISNVAPLVVSSASLVASLAASPSATVETFELTMGSSHPTVVPWVGMLSEHVVAQTNPRLEAMGSDDRVEWTESYGGALFGFKDTLEAIEDGIADAGWVGAGLWEESKMPLQTMTFHAPFVTDDQVALMRITDRLHAEVPELADAWERRNQVFLGSSGVDTYHLLTTFPVESLDDLEGRKILAPGPSGNWMSAVGAVPVNGALPTYYNAIQTGVADGVISIITGTYPNRIHEVAPVPDARRRGGPVHGRLRDEPRQLGGALRGRAHRARRARRRVLDAARRAGHGALRGGAPRHARRSGGHGQRAARRPSARAGSRRCPISRASGPRGTRGRTRRSTRS